MKIITTLAVLSLAAAAHAGTASMTITTDNHYALFTGNDSGSVMSFIGRNELGAGGNPGTYNWSKAECWNFNPCECVYIAAWSDDAVAQGVLLQANIWGSAILSGDLRFEVYGTGINRGDNDPRPTAAEMVAGITAANSGNKWETPFVGDQNGVQPWGTIAGISPNARWMWLADPNDADPLHGGSGHGEMLIFRVCQVPTPGAAAMMGLGGLSLMRRQRR